MTTPTLNHPGHISLMQRSPYGPRIHMDETNAGGGDAAAIAAAAAAAAAAKGTPWHTGIDAEIIGHAQNKGWKIDDPKEAFAGAVKQARELEKHFGVPAERLVKLPAADGKPEEWRAVHQRLGAPAEAKDYDFTSVKGADGQPLAAAIADALRAAAFEHGLSKTAATSMAATVAKSLDGIKSQTDTVTAGKIAAERAKLDADWGVNKDFNQLKAMEGARRLGISPEAVALMEKQIGYAAVMEAMRKIGVGTSEDTFVERGADGSAGKVTTLQGAHARKAELMADSAWRDRYLAGSAAEVAEMNEINRMIAA